jgi:hypothetical protein
MKYLPYLLIIIIFHLNLDSQAQLKVTRLIGEQKKASADQKAELTCIPLKISSTMKIVAVSGDNEGFWIQKESETIYKFTEAEKAIGIKLKPGTYYVYPYFKDKQLKATVEIMLK